MAIYKNREVTVGAITQPVHSIPDEIIYVTYPDGNGENVKLKDVYFTEDEKKAIEKNYPNSKYDNVNTVKDEDVKNVRLGIPPSYDTSANEVAEAQALRQHQAEANQKDMERRKAEADKKLSDKLKTTTTTTTTPVKSPPQPVKTSWPK
jgi:hypothetical protein